MAKHRGISTSDINTSEDHLLFQEDAAVNEMDNDPETEEVYASNEAPVDTVDGGTTGATKTEEVGATNAVPADIANATNVAAADGVEVFMEAATAEDDHTEDISCLDLEERREAMQRKADMEQEAMLLRAGFHVQAAKAQRIRYRAYTARAVAHAQDELLHNERSYCLVVDYGQNMKNSSFNWEQPGCAYYYSPGSVYNFGVVDHSHVYPDGHIGEHLHSHVY